MGGVGVRTEHTAGHQHLDGGLFAVHDADLPGAGVGAQHDVLGHIERILHIAGRVVLRHVQPGEVVVVVLDLRAFVDLKPHAGEHVHDLVLDEGDGMQAAVGPLLGGQRDVHRFGGVAGRQGGALHLGRQGLVLRLGPVLELVDGLAHRRAFLLGDVAQGLGQPGHRAVLAEELLPEGRQFRLVGDGCARLFNGGAQFLDLFFHSTPLLSRGGANKKAPSLVIQGRSLGLDKTPRYHPCSAFMQMRRSFFCR